MTAGMGGQVKVGEGDGTNGRGGAMNGDGEGGGMGDESGPR